MGYDGNGGENIEVVGGIATLPPARPPAPAPALKAQEAQKAPAPAQSVALLSFLSSMNNGMRAHTRVRVKNPDRTPEEIHGVFLAYIFSWFALIKTYLINQTQYIVEAIPGLTTQLLNTAKESVAKDDVPPGPQTGGGSSFFKKPAKYNELLYSTAYFPAILTLLIFLYFLVVLWWQYVLWVVGKINKYVGTNFKLPNIILKKKNSTNNIFYFFCNYKFVFNVVFSY